MAQRVAWMLPLAVAAAVTHTRRAALKHTALRRRRGRTARARQ